MPRIITSTCSIRFTAKKLAALRRVNVPVSNLFHKLRAGAIRRVRQNPRETKPTENLCKMRPCHLTGC
jgi:hypothetical protein